MTTSPLAGQSTTVSLPPEIRVVAMIFLIDILLALWFTLNWPPGMAFVVSQVPSLGVASMIWGLLPGDRKDSLSSWIAVRLQRSWLSAALLSIFGGLTLLSCVVNTVEVNGDPSSPEWVYRFDGIDERLHGAPVIVADSQRLRRGGGPQFFRVWTWPWGRTIWLQSGNRVVNRAPRVLPWRPTTLSLDDDFSTPITVAVLPGQEAMRSDSISIVLTGRAASDTIATGTLPRGGGALLFSFGGGTVSAKAAERWRATADSIGGLDSAFTAQFAATWRVGMSGTRTWRRLQLNDTVQVRVFRASKEMAVHEVAIADSLARVLVLR
jgi:hypothetical protein